MAKTALLMLDDGTCFEGEACGAQAEATGEAVFTTGMAGYQETLTDPSFHGQLVAFTAAHIGNYGVSPLDNEAPRIRAAGAVFHDLFGHDLFGPDFSGPDQYGADRLKADRFGPDLVRHERSHDPSGQDRSTSDHHPSFPHWRGVESVDALLRRQGITGITGVDTRCLTLHLREHGARMAIISALDLDRPSLLRRARELPSMQGRDLARQASCDQVYQFSPASGGAAFPQAAADLKTKATAEQTPTGAGEPPIRIPAPSGTHPAESGSGTPHGRVAVIDYGVKRSILAHLARLGFAVTVWPAATEAEAILASRPDGVLLSNGPGDPQPCDYAVRTIRDLLGRVPLFGICLGHQLLGLAVGARAYKLPFGHHGANHPVKDLASGRVHITSQNHGFCLDPDSLPPQARPSHWNLNDQTLEGIALTDVPAFSVQFHPEAAPGPVDAAGLFNRFQALIADWRASTR